MEISLINAGLAAGAALAALPVILHLFMRQTPKHVIFPALRLVRERQKRSKKRMRIKNWLLLLARMALLALMALALARPRLYSQMPLGDESVPTALGMVFDTSLSMGYKDKDKTRLDEAKDRAREILRHIPDSSLVFVVDSSRPGVPVGLSPAAAYKRIDELAIAPVNRALNVAMGQVFPAVLDCDRQRHEVYVLTDLARTSWNPDRQAEGLDRVEKASKAPGGKVATFIVRLGAKEIQDVAIDVAEPSSTVATKGESVEIKGRIRGQGTQPTNRLVEFYLDGVKKGDKPVAIPAGGGQVDVTFPTPNRLNEGEIHRGTLKLAGTPDPLDFNDVRFFTFKVRPPLRVILIHDLAVDAEFVASALETSSIQVEKVRPPEFVARFRETIKEYAAVFVLNVQILDETSWGLINAYVHEGGGLVVGLGDRCRPESYNGTTASQILPAQLQDSPSSRIETTFGKVNDVTHPLFQRYAKDIDAQLSLAPVWRYWPVKPVEGSRTLVNFANGSPALLERTFKAAKPGRALLWSTPLSRRAVIRDRASWWNDFPVTGYAFLAIMDRTVPYLAGTSSEQLNFVAGDNVLLTLEPGVRAQTFLVTGPDQKSTERLTPTSSSEMVEIMAPQQLGQWSVTSTSTDNRAIKLGFSLNPPETESQFSPLLPADLDTIFGKDGYALAEDTRSLERLTTLARVGHEVFPWLMFLIAILLTAENFLANTFYKEAGQTAAAGQKA